jgi:FkbM family methyltransferase
MSKTLRTRIGDALTPAARLWIRYAPIVAGKRWFWQKFHWRERAFCCRTRFGDRVCGHTQDLIQRHLYFFGTWEPNISGWIGSTLRSGDGFVDVGANIGHYSLLASHRVGARGCVVAIEAAQWIHVVLERHVALNRRRNIRTVQVAVAAQRGSVTLYAGDAGNIGKTSMVPRAGASSTTPALPLAEILSADEIERVRIIKIDVEGAELEVLRGLKPLLRRLRNDVEIVMEVSTLQMPAHELARDEIFATMREHGFCAYVFDNDYGVETYLRGGAFRLPRPLTDCAITQQADILFSRVAAPRSNAA